MVYSEPLAFLLKYIVRVYGRKGTWKGLLQCCSVFSMFIITIPLIFAYVMEHESLSERSEAIGLMFYFTPTLYIITQFYSKQELLFKVCALSEETFKYIVQDNNPFKSSLSVIEESFADNKKKLFRLYKVLTGVIFFAASMSFFRPFLRGKVNFQQFDF